MDCRQQLEIERLEVERLKNRILKLENTIRELRRYIGQVENETKKILTQKSGIPRGRWAFARGAYKIVQDVKRFLERGLLC